jgi:hypothetical protein
MFTVPLVSPLKPRGNEQRSHFPPAQPSKLVVRPRRVVSNTLACRIRFSRLMAHGVNDDLSTPFSCTVSHHSHHFQFFPQITVARNKLLNPLFTPKLSPIVWTVLVISASLLLISSLTSLDGLFGAVTRDGRIVVTSPDSSRLFETSLFLQFR